MQRELWDPKDALEVLKKPSVFWETDSTGLKWPMMGENGKNGCQAVATWKKPDIAVSNTATVTQTLDEAQNTLRQRVIGPDSQAEVKIDISHMAEGDIAGLAVHQKDYTYIGVRCDAGSGTKKIQKSRISIIVFGVSECSGAVRLVEDSRLYTEKPVNLTAVHTWNRSSVHVKL